MATIHEPSDLTRVVPVIAHAVAVFGDERFNIFLSNAAAQPGAGNLGQINIVIFGDAAKNEK